MAQTVYFNLMIDGGSTADPLKAKHQIVGGAVLSGDVTVSWDPTKITTANVGNSVCDFIRNRVVSTAGLK